MSTRQNIILVIILLLASLCSAGLSSDLNDYIVINAKINDQPVHLALDTGAETIILFSPTAERLGLELTDPPKGLKYQPGRVLVKYSEECTLSIEGTQGQVKSRFPVFELTDDAGKAPIDGVIGWWEIRNMMIWIDADSKHLKSLEKLPPDISTWSKWLIIDNPDFSTLLIKVPNPSGDDGVVLIDTGSPGGVHLNAGSWKDFVSRHHDDPYTLRAYYTPAVGLKVYPEYWAEELKLGALSISDVPIHEEDSIFEQAIKGLVANVGLFGLTRMEVIIDGPGGVVYTRPNKDPVSKYQYNRMGAVFVPDLPRTTQLEAHVVDDSPACQAGIRNGDILLKIGDLDVTQWQTDPNVLPLSRFWEQPAGTKLLLSLKRDGKPFEVTVELKEIFP